MEAACANPVSGSVILLENLKFHVEEDGDRVHPAGNKIQIEKAKKDIKEFEESLRRLGDIYVNDAFEMAHMPHASMLGAGFDTRASGLL